MNMNYYFISSYVTKIMLRWKSNIMASACCLTAKMEFQTIWRPPFLYVLSQRWKFNMASVCPLCFITKMEMQTNGVRHSLCLITKMEIHYGVRLSVMFDHKDGNSKVWHPLLFSNFTKIEM